MLKPKVIVILGETASGKSDLAVKIAKKIKGEVISADSRQVYKGLDLGSGKITKKEMQDVPHYLLDVASPKHTFSVAEYKSLAEEKIKEIIARGNTPIICGGTGFYIDTVTKGLVFPEVPPNIKLRVSLEKKSLRQLFQMLRKLDSVRAKSIDAHNKVRLVRAIEIAKALGKVPEIKETKPPYTFIKIGLYVPEEKLKEKIAKRLATRMKFGMLNEARKLRKQGLSWKKMETFGLEYKFTALHLQKKISLKEMSENLNKEVLWYAKRQMTWFKRDPEIKWFDASKKINLAQILKRL